MNTPAKTIGKEQVFVNLLNTFEELQENYEAFFKSFLCDILKNDALNEIKKAKMKFPIPFNILKMYGVANHETMNSLFLEKIMNANVENKPLVKDFILFLNKEFNWGLCTDSIKKVTTEQHWIDVFIKGSNFSLVIENKINARDQPGQLRRYINSANDYKKEDPNKEVYVIYLTKDGHDPSKISLPDSEKKLLGDRFQKMKHGDIGRWIEDLLKKTDYLCLKNDQKYQYLYSALVQFMDTEKILSNMTEEDNVTKEHAKEILIKFEIDKKEIHELQEYQDLFSNAEAAIVEMIREKKLNDYITKNKSYLDLAFDVVEKVAEMLSDSDKDNLLMVLDGVEKYKNKLQADYEVKNNYTHLIEIKTKKSFPNIVIEVSYQNREPFLKTYFGIWTDEHEKYASQFSELKKKASKDLDEYFNDVEKDNWKFFYEFYPINKKSAEAIAADVVKLYKLCCEL